MYNNNDDNNDVNDDDADADNDAFIFDYFFQPLTTHPMASTYSIQHSAMNILMLCPTRNGNYIVRWLIVEIIARTVIALLWSGHRLRNR